MVALNKVYNPMNLYNIALKKIENSGIRPTKQRRVLAKILFDKAKESIDPEKIEIAEFGPVVGTHVGPGAFGIGFIIE